MLLAPGAHHPYSHGNPRRFSIFFSDRDEAGAGFGFLALPAAACVQLPACSPSGCSPGCRKLAVKEGMCATFLVQQCSQVGSLC